LKKKAVNEINDCQNFADFSTVFCLQEVVTKQKVI